MASRGLEIEGLTLLRTSVTPNLSNGSDYTLQNKSFDRLYLWEGSGSPTEVSDAMMEAAQVVGPWREVIISIQSGENLYAWYSDLDTDKGLISIVEVA